MFVYLGTIGSVKDTAEQMDQQEKMMSSMMEMPGMKKMLENPDFIRSMVPSSTLFTRLRFSSHSFAFLFPLLTFTCSLHLYFSGEIRCLRIFGHLLNLPYISFSLPSFPYHFISFSIR